jgi:hypothetical protein
VDDVVAIEVQLADGARRFFLTWGRIQDEVDPEPLCALVLRHATAFSLGGEPIAARVCNTLREAADSNDAPYFYECLVEFSRARIPYGNTYESWRQERDRAMEHGREISYCGRPVNADAPT